MAISETSNACSRTIGLKPLLVGVVSTKSKLTRSDGSAPLLNAAVPGWSPSKVRKRIVKSVVLQLVDIDKARLLQGFAHVVHVEPEHAGCKLLAFSLFVGLALLTLG